MQLYAFLTLSPYHVANPAQVQSAISATVRDEPDNDSLVMLDKKCEKAIQFEFTFRFFNKTKPCAYNIVKEK